MGARFESRGGPYALTINDPAILDAIATLLSTKRAAK